MSNWYKIEFTVETQTFQNLSDLPQKSPLLVGGQEVILPFRQLNRVYNLQDDLASHLVERYYFDVQQIEGGQWQAEVVIARVVEQHNAAAFAPNLNQAFRPSNQTTIDGLSYVDLAVADIPSLNQGGGLRDGQLVLLGPDTQPTQGPSATIPEYIWVLQDNGFSPDVPYSGLPELFFATQDDDDLNFREIAESDGTVLWRSAFNGVAEWRFAGDGDDTVILPTLQQAEEIRNQYYAKGVAVQFIRHEVLGHEAFWGGNGNDIIDASSAEPIPWFLYGESGDDTLIGGSADDKLFLGPGINTLTGNGGSDRFAVSVDDQPGTFSTGLLGKDRITDLNWLDETNPDFIDLSEWDADPFTAGNQDFVLRTGGFTNNRGEVIVERVNDSTWNVFIDTRGDGQPNHHIIVENSFVRPSIDAFIGVETVREINILPGFFEFEGNTDTDRQKVDIPVSLNGDISEAVTVDYTTFDDTATLDDRDYVPTSGSLTFLPGEDNIQFISVELIGDTDREENERVGVRISNAVTTSGEAVTINTSEEFVTIKNDDVLVSIKPLDTRLGANVIQMLEGGPPQMVRLSVDDPVDFDITVSYAIDDIELVDDLELNELFLPANTKSVDVEFGRAVKDNGVSSERVILKDFEPQIESTYVNLEATTAGIKLDIAQGEDKILLRIEDEFLRKNNTAMLEAKSATTDFFDELGRTAELFKNTSPLLDLRAHPVFAAIEKWIGRLAIPVTINANRDRYYQRAENALNKYGTTDKSDEVKRVAAVRELGTELWEARKQLIVETTDAVVGFTFETLKGEAALGILLKLGAAATVAGLATVPTLAALGIGAVVVGVSYQFGYDNTIRSFVQSAAGSIYESLDPQDEYVENFAKKYVEPVRLNTQEGYLQDATVFSDLDGDLLLDPDEPSWTTDGSGNIAIDHNPETLVAVGGTDVLTGLPFRGLLIAPQGSEIISPLTTLLHYLDSFPAPQTIISDAFALNDPPNILTFDPLLPANAGESSALPVFAAAAKAYILAASVGAAVTGISGQPITQSIAQTFDILAAMILDDTFDLNKFEHIQVYVSAVSDENSSSFTDTLIEDLATILTEAMQAVDAATNGEGKTPIDVAAVQYVFLGDLIDAVLDEVENGGLSDTLIADFTGDHLTEKILQAYAALPQSLIEGTEQGDTLNTTAANDTVLARGGDDIVFNSLGVDAIDGDQGHDTVIYGGERADYTQTLNGNGTITIEKPGGGTDTLTNVERIDFSDGDYVYDLTSPNTGFGYRIYQASFGRTPDEGGVRFWIGNLDNFDQQGWSDYEKEQFLASQFIQSDEFRDLYGANPSNFDYIDAMYQNVLFRLPDQAGYDFWVGGMENDGLTREDILIAFTKSDENVNNNAANLDDGVWVV